MSNQQKLAILPMWVIDRIKEQMSLGPAAWRAITDAVDQAEVPQVLPCEVKLPPSTVIAKGVPLSTLMLAIAQRKGYPVHARSFSEQHQGEPSARELQALRDEKRLGIERLPAEPSGPKCATCRGESMFGCTQCQPDELCDDATWKRRAIEAESKLRTYDPKILELSQQEVASMLAEPRPSEVVLMKCVLCDQLQADLTALDEKLDRTQDLLRYMVYDYRSVVQAGYDKITGLGSDCDSVDKMLADNPNYQKALALLMPDLESRPEERGTPETEPCSGCGTPGYTGNCVKCVPY
ncbi:hypothetical protein D3C77_41900 [compost metagenome]